jgi:hypothetical protein
MGNAVSIHRPENFIDKQSVFSGYILTYRFSRRIGILRNIDPLYTNVGNDLMKQLSCQFL